ncbi:MAN2 [Symbiodinium natans]|uniref:mannitol 2-dehydrogenase n=1 Tax=Symbiodinium natans TaxID=878477 RepID=A0A812K9F1_9DINO|nr:MAN2 [Symbiodinium natans]
MAVSLSVDTLNWHCPPWGGLVHGPSYDRKAVTPGIVHIGLAESHRAHQAHFVDEILSSGQVDCLSWGISGVSLPDDLHLHHAMKEQSGMYVLCTRNAQEPRARIIGAYCEYLSAPEQHTAILDRLQADTTKIISLCMKDSDALDAEALDDSSEDVQSDLQALKSMLACADAAQPSSAVPLKTAPAYLVAAAALRRKRGAPPVAVLSCDAVPRNGERCASAVALLAQKSGGDELVQYIQQEWRFPSSVCDRIVYRLTPTVLQDLHRASGVADKGPVACEDFVRWVVEDQFPSGRPAWESVLGDACVFVEDAGPFSDLHLKVFEGARQLVAYAGVLLGYRRVNEAIAEPVVATFVQRYWAVVLAHGVTASTEDGQVYQAEAFDRLSQSDEELLTIAEEGCHKICRFCMGLIPNLPPMDTPTIKPIVQLLCLWVRYLTASADETETSYEHSADGRLEVLQPLAESLWQNAVKSVKGEKGETIRKQPPREETKAFVTTAFPTVNFSATVLVEVMASQLIALRANGVTSFLTPLGK